MSLQAYQRVAARTEDPREAEYRLFGQVTRALISASQTPRSEIITRMEALDWNRRLWTALSNSCSDPQNQLPKDIRAAIVSLSLFVFRHTSVIMQNGVGFEVLIDINRMIMQGLEAANANAAKAIAS